MKLGFSPFEISEHTMCYHSKGLKSANLAGEKNYLVRKFESFPPTIGGRIDPVPRDALA